jgi:hypothetical protein
MPPRNEAIMKNPFYKALFNKFDKQLERCLDGLERKMDFALRKIESRLEEVEQKMTDVVEGTIEKTKDDLNFAEVCNEWMNSTTSSSTSSLVSSSTSTTPSSHNKGTGQQRAAHQDHPVRVV